MHLAVLRMDMTIWAAKHLMLFDAILAAVVVAGLLYHRRHSIVVWWSIVAPSTFVASIALSRFASLFYADPRPFASGDRSAGERRAPSRINSRLCKPTSNTTIPSTWPSSPTIREGNSIVR